MSDVKLPEFVLNRNHTLISLTGKAIRFEKGTPRPVPLDLIREVVGIGATRVEGDNGDGFEDDEKLIPGEPTGPERDALLIAAFEELIAKNSPDDFGANNRPKASAVKEVSGLNVDAKERDRIWMIYMAKKSAED